MRTLAAMNGRWSRKLGWFFVKSVYSVALVLFALAVIEFVLSFR